MEEEEGGGVVGAARGFYTHHDNASRLLDRAHAHDGRHANSGALEVNPAAQHRGQKEGGEGIKMSYCIF